MKKFELTRKYKFALVALSLSILAGCSETNYVDCLCDDDCPTDYGCRKGVCVAEWSEDGKPDFPFCFGWANHSWSNHTWVKGVESGLNIHYGTTRLKIDFDDLTHLKGHYWNDRECTGTLTLTKKR